MSAIYHLLDESEVFSERDGGAISRWAANTLSEGEEIVICPSYDGSWGFPKDRLYQLPNWSLTSPIHPILYRLPWKLQRAAYLSVFRPLFERLRPGDVLYTHNRPESAAALATMAKRIGFRLVLHMHNSHLIRANKGQLAALKNSTIVFCSHFLRNEANAALSNHFKDTHVVYNGADGTKYCPDDAKHNLQPHIIFTGRLMPYKGVHILIDAMKILEERGISARCTIVGGSGFGKSRRTRYVNRLEKRRAINTTFAGYLSGHQFAHLLRRGDIFCCPSIWRDPFPLAPIEAMASGLPVVASNIGGLPETLAHGGGILVSPNDAMALADALQALIKDPATMWRLGSEVYQALLQSFPMEQCARTIPACSGKIARMNIFPKSSLGRNIGWMAVGQVLGFALRAVYFIIIARLLGVVQYGIVVGAFAFVNIVAQYSRAGSGMVLLRYVSANHQRFAVYWGQCCGNNFHDERRDDFRALSSGSHHDSSPTMYRYRFAYRARKLLLRTTHNQRNPSIPSV